MNQWIKHEIKRELVRLKAQGHRQQIKLALQEVRHPMQAASTGLSWFTSANALSLLRYIKIAYNSSPIIRWMSRGATVAILWWKIHQSKE